MTIKWNGVRNKNSIFPRKSQFLRKYEHLKIGRVLDRYISTVLVHCINKQSLFEGVALWRLTLRYKNSKLAHYILRRVPRLNECKAKKFFSSYQRKGSVPVTFFAFFCLYLCILIALRVCYTTNQQTLHTVYIGYLLSIRPVC